jgi:hypothetical protein
MGPQFVLAGIPTIQVGHETFEDILIRNQLSPSVTDVGQFISVIGGLTHQKKEISREVILKGLGIKTDWLPTLEKAIKGNDEVVSKPSISLCGFQLLNYLFRKGRMSTLLSHWFLCQDSIHQKPAPLLSGRPGFSMQSNR